MANSSQGIVVVGSSNLDMIVFPKTLPRPGETVFAEPSDGRDAFLRSFGGKGANQAVQAARLGGVVRMVAKVGNDPFGAEMVSNFEANGIAVSGSVTRSGSPSGCALITVDSHGANTIVVVPGANFDLAPADVERVADSIRSARVLVCQLEVPIETTMTALRLAHASGVTTLFNPAPAVPTLPPELYALCDVICPNETEAEILTGIVGNPFKSAKRLLELGARAVIVTLGEMGAVLVTADASVSITADKVDAVDTSGAGDSLIGALAYFVAEGQSLEQALRRAVRVASASVQAPGTQTSYPYRKDVEHIFQ